MFDLLLTQGKAVTPAGIQTVDVAIAGEKIAAICGSGQLRSAHRVIDLDGRVLFPGMFDPHCHLGSGDERTWEHMAHSFANDTKDCLLGGVTSIATTTVLTKNPLTENLANTVRAGCERSWIDFRVSCVVLHDDHVSQIPEAIAAGCKSFKFYCGYCLEQAEKMGMNSEGVPPDLFYRACERVAASDPNVLLMIHAEEPHVRRLLAQRLKAAGREDLLAWAEHSPQWSEAAQVMLYGSIANDFRIPLYVVHISRAPTLDLIEYLWAKGHRHIFAETLVCFLATTAQERHERGCGIRAKIQPPIRYQEDQDRLWQGIRNGTVTSIGTDTIPYTSKYKSKEPFWDARPGLNIQTIDTLPLLLTEGYHQQKIDLPTLARVTAEIPAQRFGVGHRKGRIQVGYDADLVVLDLEREATLGHRRMRGISDYSIWEGKKVRGVPAMTFLRGELVAQDGEIVAAVAKGKYLDLLREYRQ